MLNRNSIRKIAQAVGLATFLGTAAESAAICAAAEKGPLGDAQGEGLSAVSGPRVARGIVVINGRLEPLKGPSASTVIDSMPVNSIVPHSLASEGPIQPPILREEDLTVEGGKILAVSSPLQDGKILVGGYVGNNHIDGEAVLFEFPPGGGLRQKLEIKFDSKVNPDITLRSVHAIEKDRIFFFASRGEHVFQLSGKYTLGDASPESRPKHP